MAKLFTPHSRGLAATFADLENHALAQPTAPVATPGSVLERSNAAGFRYYALQQYGAQGKRFESYLAGPIGHAAADQAAGELRARIAEQRDAIDSIRLLVREGYAAMDPKPYSVIAAVGNAGLFAGGALLVGTHAFEVIVNRLGVRATSFATEDLDIARPAKLAIESMPEGGFLDVLRASGIDFVTVPNFDPGDPPIKFKERGRSRFTVDLIVPGKGPEAGSMAVPELKTQAISLPHFGYLVSQSQPGIVISRMGCVAVRVPLPERMALHKMAVARMRAGRPQKSEKDLQQAAVLVAALSERQPSGLIEAFRAAAPALRGRIAKSAPAVRDLLKHHPHALEEMDAIAKE